MGNADAYNYESFSFALDHDGIEWWLERAPRLGEAAPDFELADLDGGSLRLSDLRGRPVVLEFGSYTCPIFDGCIPAMDRLSAEHPEATFLVVYVREAHPGEITGAHRHLADKRAAARQLLAEERLERRLLIDGVDGEVHRRYGGAWNPVYVIGPDGRILLRRAWNDPERVAAVLDQLGAGAEARLEESAEMGPPIRRKPFGLGLLERGGRRALLDFYLTAPPPIQEMLRSSPTASVRTVVAETADASVDTTGGI
jgi:peroxiredoxin